MSELNQEQKLGKMLLKLTSDCAVFTIVAIKSINTKDATDIDRLVGATAALIVSSTTVLALLGMTEVGVNNITSEVTDRMRAAMPDVFTNNSEPENT